MPKIIGDYNPDWGIIRWDDNQKLKLELVRETKGQIDPNLLQFKNEKRKIDCAKNHFQTIQVDYKQVTDKIPHCGSKFSFMKSVEEIIFPINYAFLRCETKLTVASVKNIVLKKRFQETKSKNTVLKSIFKKTESKNAVVKSSFQEIEPKTLFWSRSFKRLSQKHCSK